MKLKIGTKLKAIKEQRRLSQEEMAEKLDMATTTYARYERNETNMDLETLAKVSKALEVPLHEFLPETFQINNTPNNSQGGIVFGNFIYNSNADDTTRELEKQVELLGQEKKHLEDQVASLKADKEQLAKQLELLSELLKKQ